MWSIWFLGFISIIVVIIGGFRYATSQGNQQQLQSAKNTILYAVIGLVLAAVAGPIIQFIADNLHLL